MKQYIPVHFPVDDPAGQTEPKIRWWQILDTISRINRDGLIIEIIINWIGNRLVANRSLQIQKKVLLLTEKHTQSSNSSKTLQNIYTICI